MEIASNWEDPEVIERPINISYSTMYFDDILNVTLSARDRKNMRIYDNSRVNNQEESND